MSGPCDPILALALGLGLLGCQALCSSGLLLYSKHSPAGPPLGLGIIQASQGVSNHLLWSSATPLFLWALLSELYHHLYILPGLQPQQELNYHNSQVHTLA